MADNIRYINVLKREATQPANEFTCTFLHRTREAAQGEYPPEASAGILEIDISKVS